MGNSRLRVREASRGRAGAFSGALDSLKSSDAVWRAGIGNPNKVWGRFCKDCGSEGMRLSEASRLSATRSVTPNFASREETWNFTVRSATFNLQAISLFAQP